VALGVGVGVDYGIYLFEVIRHEMHSRNAELREAFFEALRQRGSASIFTAVTMTVGVLTWLGSDLQFQSDMGILLDTNFNFKTEGYIKVARTCEPYNLFWLEIDSYDPEGLRLIRDRASMPIASCESLFSRRQFRPFFENRSIDVSIIDVPWNGLAEGYKISTMAEAYEINCAPHNFYGHMSTLMSANLCAAMPNFRIMEIDIDDVPWKDDLVTHPPVIENGELIVPTRPGWGADINEEAVKAHPPKNPHP
jgi:L-alanine-DL-glutamate epimerase-like enolase superfamily enzyme